MRHKTGIAASIHPAIALRRTPLQITDSYNSGRPDLRALEQLARRTVEEAWLAGGALPRIKQQLAHGTRTHALAERDLPVENAQRRSRLRRKNPQNRQIVVFDCVSPALTGQEDTAKTVRQI